MSRPVSVFAWAVYLASSWTWCIGLFMPTLMARDYGWAGFLVFAIPNVVGAGLMGAVLGTQSASARFAERNAVALRLFALVTLLFQGFFVGWMMTSFSPQQGAPLAGLFVGLLVVSSLAARTKIALWLAGAAMAVTVGAGVVLLSRSKLSLTGEPAVSTADLWFFAPVCVFGFALCPYLDPTFHRARRALPGGAGSLAFAIGFGVIFVIPITLTFAARGIVGKWGIAPDLVAALWIGAHTAVQLGFTAGIQGRELAAEPSGEGPSPRFPAIGLPLAALGAAVGLGMIPFDPAGLEPREFVYRSFLVFYGLLFPAYVWLVAIPTRNGHSGTSGRQGAGKLRVLIVAGVIAVPFYTIGYVWMEEIWLVPGVGVLLLARLFIPKRELG